MDMISIDQIKTDNKYLRVGVNVDKLKDSIEAVGLINPLIINKDNLLLAGGRRYTALKELGWTEVPVRQVDEGKLKEELISIDENLVRKNLEDLELEHSLCRGKQIYEELYPETKEEITLEDIKPKPPKKKLNEEELKEELDEAFGELKKKTFVQDIAHKTGLSETAIKKAILRDSAASDEVKTARMSGEIGASHVNELIKLEKETQEQILPYIREKSASVVKDMIKDINEMGVDKAIEKTINRAPVTKEYIALKNTAKRMNKMIKKIIKDDPSFDGEERADAFKEIEKLKTSFFNLEQSLYLESQQDDEYMDMGSQSEDTDEEFMPPQMAESSDFQPTI
ncbi:ParB N-terminal domain-containing protein [Halobacteriovorax sp. GB3]|uniref:ParB/RepB/Spo0J family partition protein n=1 Tax=Halobacteriovorax sp. GB3 TaxID=2719615 RepID=UPI00235F1B35|nr:ParB N-terminal domain-containing protein [Halobacteriovorax sp. GB3]MDD0852355.1 ParB N-terminal domain-containing protein [Halobacteriovorax sp. GB3]